MMMFLEVRDALFHSLFYSQVYFPLLARSTLYLQLHPITMPAAPRSQFLLLSRPRNTSRDWIAVIIQGSLATARVPSRAATSARLFLIPTKLETITNTSFRWQAFDPSSTPA